MFFIGKVNRGAVCALVLLTMGMALAKKSGQTKATWQACSGSNSKHRVLGSLPDTRVRVLSLENCQLTTLQPEDFHGLPNLEKLLLGGNNLSNVDPIVFKDLSNISTLYFQKNQVKQMLDFGKKPDILLKLETLKINDNQIEKLDNPGALSTLIKLHVFDASKNRIEYIHEDMFNKLPLKTISLSENKLKYIPEKLFQKIETLNTLFLDKNLIEYIPKDSFLGTGITELHIESNRLSYLQDGFFSQFPGGKLRTFRFERNTLHCSYLGRHMFIEILETGLTDYNADYWKRVICISLKDKSLEKEEDDDHEDDDDES